MCKLSDLLISFSIKPEEIIFKNIIDGLLDHANNLSEAFDIDIRPILEKAADQQLSARKFEDATLLYRLSKVKYNFNFCCDKQCTCGMVVSLFIYITDESVETCT